MQLQGVTVQTLLKHIPDILLDKLSEKHSVNFQVKKLSGQIVFKLLLFMVCTTERGSLNTLMTLFDDARFRLFSGIDSSFSTRRNSLADRLGGLKVAYLEAIFNHVRDMCTKNRSDMNWKSFTIQRFDSTLVGLSVKLLHTGISMGRKTKDVSEGKNFIKFTIGFDGLGINQLQFNTAQQHASEDVALAEAIRKTAVDARSVVVFDKGIKKRKTYAEFSAQGRSFVSRINATTRYNVIDSNTVSCEGIKSPTLELISDENIRFHNGGLGLGEDAPFFRLIKAKSLKSEECLYFLTNISDIDALDITEIYRLRWDIEVFFRFLKQELNFSHLLSRSLNGIKVMTYVTMIAAMLMIVYAKDNALKLGKILKLKFAMELQNELLKELIVLCGGEPEKLSKFLSN